MGVCQSAGEDRKRSNQIDAEIMREVKGKSEKSVKILLLGAGESGKSTIVKQMKIINLGGYSKEEKTNYKSIIFLNVCISMKSFNDALKKLNLVFRDSQNQDIMDSFLANYNKSKTTSIYDINEKTGIDLAALWQDPVIEEAMARGSEFYLPDSTQLYLIFLFSFMGCIEKLTKPGYIPDEQDILRTRAKTSGIVETKFTIDPLSINLYDVGGQRSERKKWIHCFEGVTSVIFVIGLTEYNQVLLEDPSVNRLSESIQLFDSVVNSRWFLRSSIIFFMNKTDLFKERLKRFPLEQYFSDYTSGFDPGKAAKYILLQFSEVNRQKLKIYPHYTNATDTSQIKVVFTAIKDTLVQNFLKGNGLL